MKLDESVEIARPPEDVFRVVADLEGSPEWQASLERVEVDGDVALGATGTEVRQIAGKRRESRFEVVALERPRRLAIESRTGPVHAQASFGLAPTAGGTRVTFELDAELGGAARLARPMVRAAAAREARDNLRRLKELLERA